MVRGERERQDFFPCYKGSERLRTIPLMRVFKMFIKYRRFLGIPPWSPYYRSICFFARLYFVTFCIILPLLTFRLKYSCYYWPGNTTAQLQRQNAENEVRKTKAMQRIEHERTVQNKLFWGEASNMQAGFKGPYLDNGVLLNEIISQQIEVLITFVSTRRSSIDGYDPKYLSQVVTTTLDLLGTTSRFKDSYRIAICNVDPDPSVYTELIYVARIFKIPVFTRFSDTSPPPDERKERYRKETNDYIYCMRKSLEMNPNYILLLEDDALPNQDTFQVLNHTVTYSLQFVTKDESSRFGFIKFYHPYRFFDRIELMELIGFSGLFGTIISLLHYAVTKYTPILRFNWIFYTLLVFLMGVALGHANLLKMRHVSKYLYTITPTLDCSTPAMLFSRKSGYAFAEYYDSHPCTDGHCEKDLFLKKLLDDTKSQGWMLMPNIFDHIGLYSVANNAAKNPENVN